MNALKLCIDRKLLEQRVIKGDHQAARLALRPCVMGARMISEYNKIYAS